MISLTLPYPPTINHYYGVRGKSRYIKKAGLEFRKAVAEIVAQNKHKLLSGRIQIVIRASPPDKRTRDLDNICKALLDSLTHAGVWEDDKQIDDLHIFRSVVVKGGEIRVIISEMKT
jgi:crossover junction endodeoxyribonuclease RusA